jgi:hypothetical protein
MSAAKGVRTILIAMAERFALIRKEQQELKDAMSVPDVKDRAGSREKQFAFLSHASSYSKLIVSPRRPLFCRSNPTRWVNPSHSI